MISLCQECHTVDGVDLKATYGLSHGICLHCMPGYLRRNGVPEKDIEELVEKYKNKEKESHVYPQILH